MIMITIKNINISINGDNNDDDNKDKNDKKHYTVTCCIVNRDLRICFAYWCMHCERNIILMSLFLNELSLLWSGENLYIYGLSVS